ncbi:integrase core domain-containing protein [Amaricoccus tamworthensis]|uniref:integrase core domain-containing protein n=1 Tax=Amaricoccus tamworthensis TaxID=57002 RepID=UPI003C79EAED
MDMEYVLGALVANFGRVHGKLLLQSGATIRSLLRSRAVFPINGRLRVEPLNENILGKLAETRKTNENWRIDYNTHRPRT